MGHQGRVSIILSDDSLAKTYQNFIAEFYDTRDAASAITLLNQQEVGEARLIVGYISEGSRPLSQLRGTPRPSYTLSSASYTPGIFGPRDPENPTARRLLPVRNSGTSDPFSDSFTGPTAQERQATDVMVGSASSSARGRYSSPPYQSAPPFVAAKRFSAPPMARRPDIVSSTGIDPQRDPPPHIAAMGRRISEPGTLESIMSKLDISVRTRMGQGIGGPYYPHDKQAIPEGNRVFPERILLGVCRMLVAVIALMYIGFSGSDRRTTVMIKDVPVSASQTQCSNKLSVPAVELNLFRRTSCPVKSWWRSSMT